MPTLVTRYVDTRSPAGGNGTTPSTGSGDANRAYANLSASLAAESSSRANLVSRDEILKIECAGGVDTSANSTHEPKFTTDDSRYLWITANSASRSNGIWDGSKYIVTSPGNTTAVFRIDFIKNLVLEGLQIENRTNTGTYVIINLTDNITQGRTLNVINCYLRAISGSETGGAGGTVGPAINYTYAIRKNLTVVNTIIHGKFSSGIYASDASNGSKLILYNNTIYDVSGSGIDFAFGDTQTTSSVYNNIVTSYRPDVAAYVTSSLGSKFFGSNISSDNSSPQTALRNITVQFANPVSGNFTLTDRFSPAVNAGTDLSTDILYPFTTDIAGNIRGTGRGGTTWDIGAVEYQLPPPTISTQTIYNATYGPPKVVTDGLVFYADSVNNKSFVSGSNPIKNLGTSQISASINTANTQVLVGGVGNGITTAAPIFNSGIDFQSLATFPDVNFTRADNFTMCVWAAVNKIDVDAINNNTNRGVFARGSYNGFVGINAFQATPSAVVELSVGTRGTGGSLGVTLKSSLRTGSNAEIFNAVLVYKSSSFEGYLNGQFIGSNSALVGDSTFLEGNPPTYGFNTYGGIGGNFGPATMSFYNASIYNRALSAAEVRQNYNALRIRYGV